MKYTYVVVLVDTIKVILTPTATGNQFKERERIRIDLFWVMHFDKVATNICDFLTPPAFKGSSMKQNQ